MALLLFLLACYGVTTIVTTGRIFMGVRSGLAARVPALGRWVRCSMCLGFAVGVGWGAVGLWPGTPLPRALDLLAAGAVSSGFCWAMRVVMHRLGEDAI